MGKRAKAVGLIAPFSETFIVMALGLFAAAKLCLKLRNVLGLGLRSLGSGWEGFHLKCLWVGRL